MSENEIFENLKRDIKTVYERINYNDDDEWTTILDIEKNQILLKLEIRAWDFKFSIKNFNI